MHPVALLGGIAALDAVLAGQALYAMRHERRRKDGGEVPRGRRVVTAWPTYRRPVAPQKRNSQVDQPPS